MTPLLPLAAVVVEPVVHCGVLPTLMAYDNHINNINHSRQIMDVVQDLQDTDHRVLYSSSSLMRLRGGGGDDNDTHPTATTSNTNQNDNPLLGSVDSSDNPAQLQVLQHHYETELAAAAKENKKDDTDTDTTDNNRVQNELLRDYDPGATLHTVIDGIPHSYHGRSTFVSQDPSTAGSSTTNTAGSPAFMLPSCDSFSVQHVKLYHNHAQVVWKASLHAASTTTDDQQRVMVGTDSFALDPDSNCIIEHTMVGLTSMPETTTTVPTATATQAHTENASSE